MLFLLILLGIILYMFYVYFNEEFKNIDYPAEKRELQQMFDDFYNYEYKNYNFSKFMDKDGYHVYPPELREQYEQNNQDYIPIEYSESTSVNQITNINDNIELPQKPNLFSSSEFNVQDIDVNKPNNPGSQYDLDNRFKTQDKVQYTYLPNLEHQLKEIQ